MIDEQSLALLRKINAQADGSLICADSESKRLIHGLLDRGMVVARNPVSVRYRLTDFGRRVLQSTRKPEPAPTPRPEPTPEPTPAASTEQKRLVATPAESDLPPILAFASAPARITAEQMDTGDSVSTVKRIAMDAYDGRAMRVAGYKLPVVVDVEGVLRLDTPIQILRDHDNSQIVGYGRAQRSGHTLTMSGVAASPAPHATEVVALGLAGFPWQASIGAIPIIVEELREGQSATVNGYEVYGPVAIVRSCQLREVSIVAEGAAAYSKTVIR